MEFADEHRIRLRIGVNLGDIIIEGSDIYGDGVNVAARLEGLAEPAPFAFPGPFSITSKAKSAWIFGIWESSKSRTSINQFKSIGLGWTARLR